jgi:hypothetical protein
MRLAPHGTIRGCTCQRRSRRRHALRHGTPRRLEVTRPRALRVEWTSALAPVRCGAHRQRPTGAAPHPSLALTGQRDAWSPLFAEDGRRAQIHCEVAEHSQRMLCHRRFGGESASIRVWCRHRESAPSYGNPVSTRDRLSTTPKIHRRKKLEKHPLFGVVCLLTNGGLRRVGQILNTEHSGIHLQLKCPSS